MKDPESGQGDGRDKGGDSVEYKKSQELLHTLIQNTREQYPDLFANLFDFGYRPVQINQTKSGVTYRDERSLGVVDDIQYFMTVRFRESDPEKYDDIREHFRRQGRDFDKEVGKTNRMNAIEVDIGPSNDEDFENIPVYTITLRFYALEGRSEEIRASAIVPIGDAPDGDVEYKQLGFSEIARSSHPALGDHALRPLNEMLKLATQK